MLLNVSVSQTGDSKVSVSWVSVLPCILILLFDMCTFAVGFEQAGFGSRSFYGVKLNKKMQSRQTYEIIFFPAY